MKPAVDTIKAEIKVVIALLQRHKDYLKDKATSRFRRLWSNTTSTAREHPASFRDSASTVPIADGEFFTEIPRVRPGARTNGKCRVGKFGACVKSNLNKVVMKLRGMNDYEPLFLS